MQYLLKVMEGDKAIAQMLLLPGENIITPEPLYRYVLQAVVDSSAQTPAAGAGPDGVGVIGRRSGDDLVIEGLASNQSLVLSDFFVFCEPAGCALELGAESGDRFIIDAAAATASSGSAFPTIGRFDARLQPLEPAGSDSLATAGVSLPTDPGSAESVSAAPVPAGRASSEPSPETAFADENGGLSTGAIIGIGAGGASVLALAASGSGADDDASAGADIPAITRVLLEGSDLVIDPTEVGSDNGVVIYGNAVNAQQVQVTVTLPGNTAANTQMVTVDAEGGFAFVFGAGFFTDAPSGPVVVTVIPVNATSGANGAPVTVEYTYQASSTAASAYREPTLLTRADLLDEHTLLFARDESVTPAANPIPVTLSTGAATAGPAFSPDWLMPFDAATLRDVL